MIEPFSIAISDEELSGLRSRLRETRWPERETTTDWSQGVPLAYLQDLCAYWAGTYDWSRCQARLNRFEHFRATIDGVSIHFIHARARATPSCPLLMLHGWPGSVLEFVHVIDPLTRAEVDGEGLAFDVICPSLPGYGFSQRPTEAGWGVERMADAFSHLMGMLGYDSYGVHGGDWGASIATAIGQNDLAHCAGLHLTQPMVVPTHEEQAEMTAEESAALERRLLFNRVDSGYARVQSTRPQTIGYALVDSPAALAAWLIEKFRSWSDCDGDIESVIPRDELLDNISLYWFTRTGASAARLYWESAGKKYVDPVLVPTGVTMFGGEVMQSSQRWVARRYRNLQFWSQPPRGGHFAALEQPEVLVDDLRRFFGGLLLAPAPHRREP